MIVNAPKRYFRKILNRFLVPEVQFTYSQFGEDLIISYLFNNLNIKKPIYLDIGANEARFISNTYYFYEQGSSGILIEPNRSLVKKLQRIRPRDTVINAGIGIQEIAEADFYIFPDYANGLSTFSKSEAEHWETNGMKGLGKIPVKEVIKMQLLPINNILEKYFPITAPNFISIDVEGLDLDILKSMNFDKFRPEVICVETLMYNQQQEGYKNQATSDFMLSVGYEIYGDTRVNTIYARKDTFTK